MRQRTAAAASSAESDDECGDNNGDPKTMWQATTAATTMEVDKEDVDDGDDEGATRVVADEMEQRGLMRDADGLNDEREDVQRRSSDGDAMDAANCIAWTVSVERAL